MIAGLTSMCLCAKQALAQAIDSPCSITKHAEHCPRPITLRPHTGLLVPCLLAQGSISPAPCCKPP